MKAYGVWAGNRRGIPEKPKNCTQEVYEPVTRRFHQCRRIRVIGEFCKQHDPEYLKAKRFNLELKYRRRREMDNQDFELRMVGARLKLENPELYAKLLRMGTE